MPRRDCPLSHREQVQLAGALAIAGLRGGGFAKMHAEDVAEYCVELAVQITKAPDAADADEIDLDLDDTDAEADL